MNADEYARMIEQLNNQGKMHFLEGTTEDQIAQFEKENDVTLPSKYKDWLLFCDGGEFYLPAGVQMYGVSHKPGLFEPPVRNLRATIPDG